MQSHRVGEIGDEMASFTIFGIDPTTHSML